VEYIDVGLICSAGIAGVFSAIIINRVTNKKVIPISLSIVRYIAWASLGGFVAAAYLQKIG
jgi:hypothetical protein